MAKIVEVSSYFNNSSFKKAIKNISCNAHQPLIDYLSRFAFKHSKDSLYKTYLFLTSDNNVAGYISFSIATIEGNDAKEHLNISRSINYPISSLKITRLLVSDDFVKMGIGSQLLMFAYIVGFILSIQTGCKAIVVDAKNDAIEFYKNNGFHKLSDIDNSQTLFMVKKIRTLNDYLSVYPEIIDEFIEFCEDYQLDIFASSLKTIKL